MANGALMQAAGVEDMARIASDFDMSKAAGPMQSATTYAPSDNALVSKQLGSLLSKDSDYMARARTRAAQSSQSRGLRNSSIAASAGEAAAIDAAMPIAQADAAATFTADRDNAAARNQYGLAANQFGYESALAKYQGALSAASRGVDVYQEDQRLGLNRDQLALQREMQSGDLALRRDALGADTSFRTSQLQLDRDRLTTDEALQRAQMEQQAALQREGMVIDRDQLALQREMQAGDLALRRDQFGADTAYRTADLDFRRSSADRELGLNERELGLNEAFRRDQLGQQGALQREELGLNRDRLGLDRERMAIDQEQTALERDRLQQQSRSALAGDIAQIRNQAAQARLALEQDPNMSFEAKAAAITALGQKAEADIEEMVRFSGISLPEAWPDWINRLNPAPAPTSPAPSPPPDQPQQPGQPQHDWWQNPGGF